MTGIKSDRVFKFGAKNFRKFAVKTFFKFRGKTFKKIDSRLDGIVASTSNWTLYIVIGIEVVLGIVIIAI